MFKKNRLFSISILCVTSAFLLSSCVTTNKNARIEESNKLIELPSGKPVDTVYKDTIVQNDFEKRKTRLEMALIHKTPTPIWQPPVMAKVLIMPHVDKNNILHSYQYVYTQLLPGRWLVGRYLVRTPVSRMFKPLEDGYKTNKNFTPLNKDEIGKAIGQTSHKYAKASVDSGNNYKSKSFFKGAPPRGGIDTTIPTTSFSSGEDYKAEAQAYFR